MEDTEEKGKRGRKKSRRRRIARRMKIRGANGVMNTERCVRLTHVDDKVTMG